MTEDSIQEMFYNSEGIPNVSHEQLEKAFLQLGLKPNATMENAKETWRETLAHHNLAQLTDLGETFVTAALSRITTAHEAYKTILAFFEQLEAGKRKPN